MIWNSLKVDVKTAPIDKFGNLLIPAFDNIYFYNERKKELKITTQCLISKFLLETGG